MTGSEEKFPQWSQFWNSIQCIPSGSYRGMFTKYLLIDENITSEGFYSSWKALKIVFASREFLSRQKYFTLKRWKNLTMIENTQECTAVHDHIRSWYYLFAKKWNLLTSQLYSI